MCVCVNLQLLKNSLFMTALVLQPPLVNLCWLAGVFLPTSAMHIAKMKSRVGKHKTLYSADNCKELHVTKMTSNVVKTNDR